jgi:GNAT superfamily N-acetyltransferase
LYPSDQEYAAHFPRFVAAFGGGAFDHDTVWQTDDFAAVALWFPPETGPDGDELVTVLMETTHPSRHPDTMVALQQMEAAHPRFRHWYLPWLGVDGASQGAGLGGALLVESLKAVDDSALPAYLETPNPRTVPLYERHGFRVTGSTETQDSPPIVFMLREAVLPRSEPPTAAVGQFPGQRIKQKG